MASFQFWIGQLSVLSFVYAMDCIVDNLIGLASRFWENKKSD